MELRAVSLRGVTCKAEQVDRCLKELHRAKQRSSCLFTIRGFSIGGLPFLDFPDLYIRTLMHSVVVREGIVQLVFLLNRDFYLFVLYLSLPLAKAELREAVAVEHVVPVEQVIVGFRPS